MKLFIGKHVCLYLFLFFSYCITLWMLPGTENQLGKSFILYMGVFIGVSNSLKGCFVYSHDGGLVATGRMRNAQVQEELNSYRSIVSWNIAFIFTIMYNAMLMGTSLKAMSLSFAAMFALFLYCTPRKTLTNEGAIWVVLYLFLSYVVPSISSISE